MRSLAITLGIALLAASSVRAQEDVEGRMKSWSTALGVGCVHCHVPDQWSDSSKPVFAFAQRMSRMVSGLNAGLLKDLGGITCWTCHRGRTVPARVRREAWQQIQTEHSAEFEGRPNRALAMSVYSASLGVDCSHCHEQDRTANTKPPKAVVARMLSIIEAIPTYFDNQRQPVTQCYLCHQGAAKPERAPR